MCLAMDARRLQVLIPLIAMTLIAVAILVVAGSRS
jgi:hypothetical protein